MLSVEPPSPDSHFTGKKSTLSNFISYLVNARTASYVRRDKQNDVTSPILSKLGYSPSVSSWLMPEEPMEQMEDSSATKFYDELDNFVLEEEVIETDEAGGSQNKTLSVEPAPSVRIPLEEILRELTNNSARPCAASCAEYCLLS